MIITHSNEALRKLKSYPEDKLNSASEIVQKQAIRLASAEAVYANKVLHYYNIVYAPIVLTILERNLSKNEAGKYAMNQLKESLDVL